MQTKKWVINRQAIDMKLITEASHLIKKGELLAFPTETVYGLGADATNEEAVKKIFQVKGRPSDNPLIIHLANVEQLGDYVQEIPNYVKKLLEKFSPGPITYVLKSSGMIAPSVTAGLDTVAVRIPSHPIALELIKSSGLPIAAPSANVSGRPSPTMAQHVIDDMDGKIAGIIDGGLTDEGLESTVIDCTNEKPVVLRLGGLSVKEMTKIMEVNSVKVIQSVSDDQSLPKSPGLKYKHYAPDVPLIAIIESKDKLQQLISEEKAKGHQIGLITTDSSTHSFKGIKRSIFLGRTKKAIAKKLYASFRTFKKEEVDVVICFVSTGEVVGHAVFDRIKRAASIIYE